jgi:hypothetical protein
MRVYVILLHDWDKIQSGIYAGKAFYTAEEAEQFLIQDTGLSRDELFPDNGNVNGDEFSIEELTVQEQPQGVVGSKNKD